MGEAFSKKVHVLIFLIILILLGNTVWLTLRVLELSRVQKDSGFNVVNMATPSADRPETAPTSTLRDSCYPDSCVDLIKQATSSLTPKKQTATQSTSSANEFYVPFGNGETISEQWQDVPGLQAYIDSSKYGKIKTATFEAAMRIPTANGRVYAQLYNVTDSHPVWFSEVSMEGNTSKLVISSPIALDTGNKLYKVQMKTTLKYLSILDQARVHIITQ